jgi:hypothetical protein
MAKCYKALNENWNIFSSFSKESVRAFKNTTNTLPSITLFAINDPKISLVMYNSFSGN